MGENKMKWTKEWPKKSGNYWFYGWTSTFCLRQEKKALLYYIKILINGKTTITNCEGVLIWEHNGGYGLWRPVGEIELPEIEKPENKPEK